MSKFYRAIKAFFIPITKLIFRVKVVGIDNVPKDKPFMLCCNHTSMLDIVLLIAFCPRAISFMAKKEIFKVPVLSGIFKKMGAFPVDRGGRDITSIRHSMKIIEDGNVLGIFPEGKRYRQGPMREVKTGCAFIASKTGADVLPVCIYKEGKAHPFRKVTLRFGEVIPNDALCDGKPTKEKLIEMSDIIHKSILKLWELKF